MKVVDTKSFVKEKDLKVVYRRHACGTQTLELDFDTLRDMGLNFIVSGNRRNKNMSVELEGGNFKWQF